VRFFRGDPIHGETEEMMIVVPLFEKEKYTEPVRRNDIDVRSYLAGEGLENMIYRLVSYQNCEEAIKASIHLNKKKIFISEEHKKLFKEILEGYRGKSLRSSRRYLAAVFLLSADKDLWESVEQNVTDMGIFFDNIHLKGLSTDQYILLHIAEGILRPMVRMHFSMILRRASLLRLFFLCQSSAVRKKDIS